MKKFKVFNEGEVIPKKLIDAFKEGSLLNQLLIKIFKRFHIVYEVSCYPEIGYSKTFRFIRDNTILISFQESPTKYSTNINQLLLSFEDGGIILKTGGFCADKVDILKEEMDAETTTYLRALIDEVFYT